MAALESSDTEALAALLESSDSVAPVAEIEYEEESVSSAAPLESEDTTEAQDTAIDDASLETLELTYFNSDSENLMVNTSMMILK